MYNGSLTRKRVIKDINGNDIVDICAPTVNYKELINLSDGFYMVRPEEEMRLDLVANTHFADVEKLDAIMWRNDIYNPFSIEGLEIINIPYAKNNEAFYMVPPVQNLPDAEDNSTQSQITRASSKLNNSIESNRLKNGQTAKTVKGKNIILGTHLRNEQ